MFILAAKQAALEFLLHYYIFGISTLLLSPRHLGSVALNCAEQLHSLVEIVPVSKHGDASSRRPLLVESEGFPDRVRRRIRVVTFSRYHFQGRITFKVWLVNQVLKVAVRRHLDVVLVLRKLLYPTRAPSTKEPTSPAIPAFICTTVPPA